MESYAKFIKDITKQFPVEQKVYSLLTSIFGNDDNDPPVEKLTKNFNRFYDFKVQGSTYELKNHLISYKTGNVSIEWQCRGKLSGIHITKADYQLHIVNGDTLLVIPTATEKEYLNSLIHNNKIIVRDAGDLMPDGRKASKVFLVTIAEYTALAEHVFKL